MKKHILLAIISLFIFASCNQNNNKVRYKMFNTENIWTFLKLDTKSGKIWQVQYSIDDNNRGEVVLNDKELVNSSSENGRFTLYPTKNMYNFILLDQIDGKMWQVQWSFEEENRVVIPI